MARRYPTIWPRPSVDAYHRLGSGTRVAVRSSGTSEDSAGTSFAGMNATFTNVAGDEELLGRVVDCWASLYGETGDLVPGQPTGRRRAVARRGRPADDPFRALGRDVHRRPVAGASRSHRHRGGLRSGRGRGERPGRARHLRGGTHGAGTAQRPGGHQDHQDRAGSRRAATSEIALDPGEGSRRVLSDDEVLGLASLGLAVEAHYGSPQDVEWAIAGGHTYLVQSRPITTLAGSSPPGSVSPARDSVNTESTASRRSWCRGWRRRPVGRRAASGCCTPPPRATCSRRVRSWSRP